MEPMLHKWYLRVVGAGGKPLSKPAWITALLRGAREGVARCVDRDSVWQGLRCCVCWQAPLFTKVKDHGTSGCPLLATFNKVRNNAKLVPLAPTPLGLSTTPKKVQVKVEEVEEALERMHIEVQGELADLKKRLVLMEQGQSQKRKAEEVPASAPPEKKKKKSKKEKAKGSLGGQTGVPVEGAAKPGNSGKGKRKGKRRASPPPSNRTNVPSRLADWESDDN